MTGFTLWFTGRVVGLKTSSRYAMGHSHRMSVLIIPEPLIMTQSFGYGNRGAQE